MKIQFYAEDFKILNDLPRQIDVAEIATKKTEAFFKDAEIIYGRITNSGNKYYSTTSFPEDTLRGWVVRVEPYKFICNHARWEGTQDGLVCCICNKDLEIDEIEFHEKPAVAP